MTISESDYNNAVSNYKQISDHLYSLNLKRPAIIEERIQNSLK